MQRFIYLRVCHLLWFKTAEIKELTAICEEHYRYKAHPLFIHGRPQILPTSFCANPEGGCTITGMECVFSADFGSYRTVFLDTPVAKGVFLWEAQIAHGSDDFFELFLGAAPADLLSQCNRSFLGAPWIKGSASFCFWKTDGPTLRSTLYGVEGHNDIPREETLVADNSLVAIEADTHTGTLRFFVNGREIPRTITGMHFPAHLGITGHNGPSFASVSFRRLPTATMSSVVTPKVHSVEK